MAIIDAGIQEQNRLEPGAASPDRFRALLLAERAGQEAVVADCAVTDQHAPWARDPASAERLWSLSETLVGKRFPLT